MNILREILRCLRSPRYKDYYRGMETMKIGAMYGACSRMENCRICRNYHVIFTEKRQL